jgi:hypothetical protein
MGTRATGAFEITAWEQVAYDEAAEGPKLARATVRNKPRHEVLYTSLQSPMAEKRASMVAACERWHGKHPLTTPNSLPLPSAHRCKVGRGEV